MRLRFRIWWTLTLLLCVSVTYDGAAQGPGGSGGTREDVVRIVDKARPMLEVVELLQKRTGRPISYEDPKWEYEGSQQRQANGTIVAGGAEVLRVKGFATATDVALKDILTLVKGAFEVKLIVDARTHLLAEPVDGSLGAIFQSILPDYASRRLPGDYTYAYLGNPNEGGYGWVIVPRTDLKKDGSKQNAVRVLDYPISFPAETRPTEVTFELIAQLVQKASGQIVQFKHVASDAMTSGRTTTLEPVRLPARQTVRIGANMERARDVIAKALKTIDRGDPLMQGPIPQRAWRLLYLYDKQMWALDVDEVKQALFTVNGQELGFKTVNWVPPVVNGLATTVGASDGPTGLSVQPFVESPVGPFGRPATPIVAPAAPVTGSNPTPLVPNGVLLSNGAIVAPNTVAVPVGLTGFVQPVVAAPTGSSVAPFVESPVGPFGRPATPIVAPAAPVTGSRPTPLVPNGVQLSNGAIVAPPNTVRASVAGVTGFVQAVVAAPAMNAVMAVPDYAVDPIGKWAGEIAGVGGGAPTPFLLTITAVTGSGANRTITGAIAIGPAGRAQPIVNGKQPDDNMITWSSMAIAAPRGGDGDAAPQINYRGDFVSPRELQVTQVVGLATLRQ